MKGIKCKNYSSSSVNRNVKRALLLVWVSNISRDEALKLKGTNTAERILFIPLLVLKFKHLQAFVA